MKTNSVRALQRGLAVIEHLNKHDGATITDIMHVLDIPYATTYRLLKTLCDLGMLTKGHRRGEYWLAAGVRSLSGGYEPEIRLSQYAMSALDMLSEQVRWPVYLLQPRAHLMVVSAKSRAHYPLIKGEIPLGDLSNVEHTAAGLVYGAFASRKTFPEALQPANAELRRRFTQVRKDGFATYAEPEHNITQIAVPIFNDVEVFGGLMSRANALFLKNSENVECFLRLLRATAQQMEQYLSESEASPPPTSAQAAAG